MDRGARGRCCCRPLLRAMWMERRSAALRHGQSGVPERTVGRRACAVGMSERSGTIVTICLFCDTFSRSNV